MPTIPLCPHLRLDRVPYSSVTIPHSSVAERREKNYTETDFPEGNPFQPGCPMSVCLGRGPGAVCGEGLSPQPPAASVMQNDFLAISFSFCVCLGYV